MTTRCIKRKHLLCMSAALAFALWPSVSQATTLATPNVISWTASGATDLTTGGAFFISSVQYPTIAAWDAGAAAASTTPGAFAPTGLVFQGGLNLDNNDLIVNADTDADSQAAYSLLYQAAAAGYNNGAWTGNSNPGQTPGPIGGVGIYSDASQTSTPSGNSAATDPQALTAVGVILNDGNTNNLYGNDTGYTSFDGDAVNSDTVLVKYTYYGDTQFNGKVTEQDVINAAFGRDFAGVGWANGETQYTPSGVVNEQDVINVAFSRDFYASDPIVDTSSPSVALSGGGAIGVPEPPAGLIAILAAAGLVAFGFRRGRRVGSKQTVLA